MNRQIRCRVGGSGLSKVSIHFVLRYSSTVLAMVLSVFRNLFPKRVSSSKIDYIHEDYRSMHKRSYQVNRFNAPFRECFRSVLIVIQLNGLFPIGYNANGSYRLRVASIKYLYSVFVGLVILGLSVLSLMKALHDNMEFDKMVTSLFYFVDFMVVVQFQVLAVQWANIMVVWSEFEATLDNNEQLLGKRFSLKALFQMIIASVTLMTLFAEILSVIAGIEHGDLCVGVDGLLQRYFRQAFPQVFLYTGYTLWKGVLLQISQFFCTFIRMFIDVFLILISLGLGRLISRLNLQYGLPRRVLTDEFWARYKEQYQQFANLVQFVDKRIGHLTILCFLSDLYLICIRILKSFQSMDTFRQALFFWYALLFLIGRFVIVCIVAANFHEETKRPLKILDKVPASRWSMEAQRFQDLVTHTDVCLTGIGFFKLRRTLLLSVSSLL